MGSARKDLLKALAIVATCSAISAGTLDGTTVGLVMPTEEVCTQCHTAEGNPFFKEFDFEARVQEIAHPRPEAEAETEAEAEAEAAG